MIQAFTWVLNSLVLCILGKWTTFWMFTWVFCSLDLIYFVIRTKKGGSNEKNHQIVHRRYDPLPARRLCELGEGSGHEGVRGRACQNREAEGDP